MKNSVWEIILVCCAILQLVLAMIAEYNEEYTKAVYEMLWCGLLYMLLKEERNND